MAGQTANVRPTGARAVMAPQEPVRITSATGEVLTLSTHVARPGFNPLDLLYSAMAGCIALSARIAAQKLGVLERLGEVSVQVRGEKAPDSPSRVAAISVEIAIGGDLDPQARQAIAAAAEGEICTVSNTLRGRPKITARLV